jgi:hypothetical protein
MAAKLLARTPTMAAKLLAGTPTMAAKLLVGTPTMAALDINNGHSDANNGSIANQKKVKQPCSFSQKKIKINFETEIFEAQKSHFFLKNRQKDSILRNQFSIHFY